MNIIRFLIRAGFAVLAFLFLVCLFLAPGFTQTFTLSPVARQQFFNASGAPVANGFLCVMVAGTTTPVQIYSDSSGTLLPDPVRLNASGLPETGTSGGGTETGIYIESASSYKYLLYAAGTGNTCNGHQVGALIRSQDNIYDLAGKPHNITSTYLDVPYASTMEFNEAQSSIFKTVLTGNVSSSAFTNPSIGQVVELTVCQDGTGGRTFVWPTGTVNAPTVNATAAACTGASFYFDSASVWQKWETLALPASNVSSCVLSGVVDASVAINNAIGALPSSGGVVDCRGLSGVQTFSTNPFDSTTKAVVVLLGGANFHCTYATSSGGTAACIVPHSNQWVAGAGQGITVISQYNVANNASFNRIFETNPDASNIQISNLEIDGRKSAITACASGVVQNAGIILDGLASGKFYNLYIHDTCGDGIENESGSSNAYSSNIEITGNRFVNAARGQVTVISGVDVDIHDNQFTTSVGFDQVHSEPDTSGQYVLRINVHHNDFVCTGNTSAVIIGGYAAADSTKIGFNHIDGNIATGCGYEIFRSPYSSINNNTTLNAYPTFSGGAISLATHESTAIGNRITYTTSTGTYGLMVSCTDQDVPAIGDGFNVVTGNLIKDAPSEAIRILWCNHSVINDNTVHGIRTVAGTANCIHIGDNSGGMSGQYNLVQGNTCTGSATWANFQRGVFEDNTAVLGAGNNRVLDNLILNNTAEAYRAGVAGPTIWRIAQSYAYADLPFTGGFGGGYPGLGSSVLCTDCKNVADNGEMFAAVASSAGSGGMVTWITGTAWRVVN